jgi:hypothetical protein
MLQGYFCTGMLVRKVRQLSVLTGVFAVCGWIWWTVAALVFFPYSLAGFRKQVVHSYPILPQPVHLMFRRGLLLTLVGGVGRPVFGKPSSAIRAKSTASEKVWRRKPTVAT